MTLGQRISIFESVFIDLQNTNSRLEKEQIISTIPAELQDDWQYILEILAGKHKLGYTYRELPDKRADNSYLNCTIKQYIAPLYEPMNSNNFTDLNAYMAMIQCQYKADFIAPIVNRTLRLGIGPSQLPKDGLAPMLAKKFEDVILNNSVYYITEKLDGNRCIARYDGSKWLFTSRNGKPLKVNIDMGDLPTDVVYDGELLSPQQTHDSIAAANALRHNLVIPQYHNEFNKTSGLINSKSSGKQLVYNIFDVMTDDCYYARRRFLDSLNCTTSEIRILPVLAKINCNYESTIESLLNRMTSAGAEGVILNNGDATYQHKRTADLIKVKNTYTMDMLVVDWEYGTGKYDGMVGALHCEAIADNKYIAAKVGSGLSDEQRELWAMDPSLIVGKIIEVGYFSMSQNANLNGTKYYSLRFPRLKQVRYDKEVTSID